MLAYEREIVDLAEAAIRKTLAGARTMPSLVSDLVTVSCTGFAAPGFDIELISRLPLDDDVRRHHLGFMGCHGAINGLRVASALRNQNPGRPILMCAAELCTVHFQYGWEKDSLVANSLFADGAAALIVTAGDTNSSAWQLVDSASHLVANSLDAMSWKIKDNGFVMSLSAALPDLIASHLPGWLDSWLSRSGKNRQDIRAWAIHPGGPRILDAAAASLNLTERQLRFSRGVLADHGNMSSPTIIFILERIWQELGQVPTVLLAFGPGLTIEAALLA